MRVTREQLQSILDNPPCHIEWQSIVGDLIQEPKSTSKVSLLCSCGTIKTIETNSFLTLNTKSCGCYQLLRPNRLSHGGKGSRLYSIYSDMKRRVLLETRPDYKNYGGRGIKVCDEWLQNFELFRDWALNNGYNKLLTLDRQDNDGDYCPKNCRWITRQQQNKNRRSTRLVTIGPVTLCISDWCKELSISRDTVNSRIKRGWSEQDAILTPVRKSSKINTEQI